MSDQHTSISPAFKAFLKETPAQAKAWGQLVQDLAQSSALDSKTRSLAYLAVLAALRLESGIPFHVSAAKEAGASREEILSAILVGLPATGHVVTQSLPKAIEAFDGSG